MSLSLGSDHLRGDLTPQKLSRPTEEAPQPLGQAGRDKAKGFPLKLFTEHLADECVYNNKAEDEIVIDACKDALLPWTWDLISLKNCIGMKALKILGGCRLSGG